MVPMELYNDLKDEVKMLEAEVDILRLELEAHRSLLKIMDEKIQRTDPDEAEFVKEHGELVDKAEARRLLGVAKCTVYKWIANGRIKTDMSGKRVSVRSIYRYMNGK